MKIHTQGRKFKLYDLIIMYSPIQYFSFFVIISYSAINSLESFKNSILHLIKERTQTIKIVLISNKLQPLYQSRYKNI